MTDTGRAHDIARSLLERLTAAPLGARTRGRRDGPDPGSDPRRNADLLTAAAILHDIGYAPRLAEPASIPLMARGTCVISSMPSPSVPAGRPPFLRHHRSRRTRSRRQLAREFKPAPRDLADALIYCDMTTGPDGQHMTIDQRLADIRARYGPETWSPARSPAPHQSSKPRPDGSHASFARTRQRRGRSRSAAGVAFRSCKGGCGAR